MESISIGEARARFSELISRVVSGERVLIRRREHPVAVLIEASEFERLERASQAARHLAEALGQNPQILQQIDQQLLHPAMAAFGLWRDDPAFEVLVEGIAAERRATYLRPEVEL
ncbi:MAG: hypothetical protein BWY63_01839 [Chloroflexi bacterium ADurb.Bin360]|nr:MAG: hypothetical protein BWY63_01839 [Chloroflexi bacterium ADurb.Bin360]